MKNWAWMVAVLYAAVLLTLTLPTCLLAFAPGLKITEAVQAFAYLPYWVWLLLMILSQMALLAVPVRIASRRPLTRGPIWRTILAGGLAAGFLVAGIFLSLYEFLTRLQSGGNWCFLVAAILGVLTWIGWAIVFCRVSRKEDAPDIVSRQCRCLIKGSILELLIAVPTHVVARYRDYCCAGVLTFIGLTMGISVMLFAYGPAIYFLFAARWRHLHPQSEGGAA